MLFKPRQHGIKKEKLSMTFHQPGTKFTQDRVVKSWIVKLQTQRIFSVQSCADGVRCITVAELFQKLEHGDQGQSPW